MGIIVINGLEFGVWSLGLMLTLRAGDRTQMTRMVMIGYACL
jgi:hypothetical protein